VQTRHPSGSTVSPKGRSGAIRRLYLGLLVGLLLPPIATRADVVVRIAPPAPRYEVVPASPGERYVWVPGHWQWVRGRYIWRQGYYVVRPRPRAVWVPAHYTARNGYWTYVPGHWRYR
jgi:WXXGXW repeat (2 copies)